MDEAAPIKNFNLASKGTHRKKLVLLSVVSHFHAKQPDYSLKVSKAMIGRGTIPQMSHCTLLNLHKKIYPQSE